MREIEFRVRDLEVNKFINLEDFTITIDKFGLEVYQHDGMTLDSYEINQYTGVKDKNETKVYEGDLIPYHFNEDIKGVVKYGEYRNPCDDKHATHIGFYVYWEDEKYKDTMRKDLGYWLKVSCVCGNIYENN